MPYSQTIQGARARLEIITPAGPKTVAFATGVSYNESHEHIPIYTLDRLEPQEFAPVAYSCSVSCTTFRVPGMSPKSQGFQQKLQDILTQPNLQIKIYDRKDDVELLVVDQVKFLGRSGGVSARGEATESWEFAGIVMWDEAGPSSTSASGA